jgi:uroporphyrinogen decarboxylase
MTSRERVLTALSRRQPDRVPLFYRDEPEVEARLLRDLGLATREELLRFLHIDFRWVAPHYIGPPLDGPGPERRRDIWGIEYRYVPAEHGGNWEQVTWPLAKMETPAHLADHPWPKVEWFDFSVLDAQFREYAPYATMTGPGVPSPNVMQMSHYLTGMERGMMDMVLNPDFYDAVLDRVMAFNLAYQERFFAIAGTRLDFYRVGDDYGTQRGLLLGPDQWRKSVRPWIARLLEIPRRHGARYYHHSCGAVRKLIPDLIDAGVDVLDPLQVKAEGMDPAELKAEFGARLCFSGGVDEQELLPRGTPADVKRAVRELLRIMAPGGGFFIGPTHNFQPDIPTANILALYESARDPDNYQ